jgi:hypothetical protein
MTETQQRFLRAIAERVPMDQVVELHLFPPIRQGGVETGVAVVAEDSRRPSPVASSADPDATDQRAPDGIDVTASNSPEPPSVEVAEFVVQEPAEADGDESPYAADARDDDEDAAADGDDDDEDDDDVLTGAAESAARVAARLTIHTARYRLTLKGVDRGKWEVDVVAEADAPLAALDAVVRGVQRRAGEGAEPDRLSAEAWRDALAAPLASLER